MCFFLCPLCQFGFIIIPLVCHTDPIQPFVQIRYNFRGFNLFLHGSQAYMLRKGVHQFRFFLPTIRTPNSIVVCSCMYAFLSPPVHIHWGRAESTYPQGSTSCSRRLSLTSYWSSTYRLSRENTYTYLQQKCSLLQEVLPCGYVIPALSQCIARWAHMHCFLSVCPSVSLSACHLLL